ncbi:AraC family transcriptional regulator of adaptative response/methylated-DNA-[protein]-cysteine methyltransferase [Haloferula luteola]|uniref:AraC family transcriptional regulator of adaptative response/methylated-DNA-[protein]-cysteine methyltransferase n=1 Tax=Haloferula luteola TaxID=595692 RepID=A0A840VEF4_9BACT|nr:bifunctional DNA-binding transcriptional regulator/O6-methylguanine-DNA methyltransferase Ada [Haloferula luteola]MBB5353884.1 AraC family transcriptional regulator of adaptative response/methylated-DNA-[protein]-cysteine methyltransferase [Haloferula luteola]
MKSVAGDSTPGNPPADPPPHFRTDDERWLGLANNDARADGQYFYAVKSTGVYCRPSCPSRLPLRRNVVFFDQSETAEQAGFRPCKRCQPQEVNLGDPHTPMVENACRLIQQSEIEPSLDDLATSVGMSKHHFHRLFVQKMGMTPKAYMKALRAERMRGELTRGGSVTRAIYDAGYQSNRQFYEEATQILGMSPKQYQAGGKGERIGFALGQCSLGSVLVASSMKGICALSLGDDPERMVEALKRRFAQAELIRNDPPYERLVARVVEWIDSTSMAWDLPLDIRGTAFQQRVWQALRKVPSGSRRTYSELAEELGNPHAVRAVASACAANELAMVIPCHRVVRRDGSLSGYRWGVERKKLLLEREQSTEI